ncbi:hypothetical protein [Burkholderia stabilis]|uniref:hypothetical protein n=1 Tax=Burkholderia stabilis TaxID=95485 RepID=UPI0009F717DD|nr:hypothetical protein [Burkholderia stabilis]HDR9495834.1 hypothetical protein [Burkholderia stabilis]HDR9527375.1 hypothetical protein [Burkholderia stabilis]HDR9542465.1 hypothetical protein [Burkholderia stabilis]HDR9580909.1 hypothetical protein [Burkholderia stabilis]HDR9585738.1 hypothetical protein [Burkholderia stabilis]
MENKENLPESVQDAHAHDKAKQQTGTSKDIFRAGISLASDETVRRYGSAGAEFVKGYRGVDNETGQKFAKGLADIAKHKVNSDPLEAAKNIKQQAGFSAEVAATSRDNAEAVISGSGVRTTRSDDLAAFGRNHNVVDRVQLLDGQIIEGSQAQMKFVGDRNDLFSKIAREDGKFARYRGVKLELPSEQYDGAQAYCQKRAEQLRNNAQAAEAKGKPDVAAKLRREAENYETLGENVRDSGLTTEQAIFYREHPELATILDIARTSHRAGMEGAKYGAVIGGTISVLKNTFAVAQKRASLGDAALEVAKDVGKAGALGYGTAFVGAATKSVMQQSGHAGVRALANTSVPTLAVTACLSLGVSIKRYVHGEISESEFLVEVGEKGAGMLSSGMFAALGQIAIPIPFVGAAVGGMVGYTLSSMFYQSAVEASRAAELSRKNLARTREIAARAHACLAQERIALETFYAEEMPRLLEETRGLIRAVDAGHESADELAAAVNRFAELLGRELPYASQQEFDSFMASDMPLKL